MATQSRNNGTSKGDSANAKWHAMLQQLLRYKEKHGNTLVPNRYAECPQLGSWVSTQRRQYKSMIEKQRRELANEPEADTEAVKGSPMSPERAKILEEIGFVWSTTDPRHVPWETRFSQLLEFKSLYGHCLVPIKYPENPQLSNWVSAQRQEFKLIKGGKTSSRLTEEKIKKLDEAGFIWEAQRGGPRRKHEKLSAQKSPSSEKKRSNSVDGDVSDCASHSFETSSFGSEAATPNGESATMAENLDQPSPFKKRRKLDMESNVDSMSDSESKPEAVENSNNKETALHTRTVSPNPHSTQGLTSWDDFFGELLKFKEEHGHVMVPANCSKYARLYDWVREQREVLGSNLDSEEKTGSASRVQDERFAMLDKLGFVWEESKSEESHSWNTRFQQLKQYKAIHGNVLVPNRYSENPALGKWVSTQRRQHKLLKNGETCSMTQSRIDALDALGFVWEVRSFKDKTRTSPESVLERELTEQESAAMTKEANALQGVLNSTIGIPSLGMLQAPLDPLHGNDPSALLRLSGVLQGDPRSIHSMPILEQGRLTNLLMNAAVASNSPFSFPPLAPPLGMQPSHLSLPPWLLAKLKMDALAEEERRRALEELLRQQELARELNLVAVLAAISKSSLDQQKQA